MRLGLTGISEAGMVTSSPIADGRWIFGPPMGELRRRRRSVLSYGVGPPVRGRREARELRAGPHEVVSACQDGSGLVGVIEASTQSRVRKSLRADSSCSCSGRWTFKIDDRPIHPREATQ